MIIKKLVFLAALFLISCASTSKITTDSDISYDLSKYRTFNIEAMKLAEDVSQISLNPILAQRVHRSIVKELNLKQLKKSDKPGLLVKVLVGTEREINKSYESSSFMHSGYRWRDSDTRYYKLDREAIAVRFYDANSSEVVWYAFSRLNKSDNNDQESVDKIVKSMMKSFLN